MICEVVIYDFHTERRMVYVLDDDDFALRERCWEVGDPLLDSMQSNVMFAGKQRWCDLDVMHYHVLILNILKILGTMNDSRRSDHADAVALRLTFFLCCLVSLLQERSYSLIELLRIKRLNDTDLVYDFCATLTVGVMPPSPPKSCLHLVNDP